MSRPSLPYPAWADMNPETLVQARLLRFIVQILIAGTLLLYVPAPVTISPWSALIAVTLLLAVEIGAWFLLRNGHPRAAAWTLLAGLWSALTTATFLAPANGNIPFFGLILVALAAGFLIHSSAAFVFATFSALAGAAYLFGDASRLLPTPVLTLTPFGEFMTVSAFFFAAAGLTALVERGQQDVVASLRAAAEEQAESADKMARVRQELESQVAERTHDLERRTRYLQAAAEVSRAAAANLDPRSLMQTAVDLIMEKFDLYYTGVFVTEPSGEWALLQAGAGEPGRRMMARGHRIRVGSGMIGWSIANAQPRIALDVGRDAVRLATSELPETRSEAAIPLRSRGRVLGAMTVQSNLPEAFGEVEITIFQSLADQLAIALDNARLFSESSLALEQAQRAYRQASGRAWQEFLQAEGASRIQYRYGQIETETQRRQDAGAAELIAFPGKQTQAAENARLQAIQGCRPALCMVGEQPTLFLPIQSRDQVVGVLRLAKASGSGLKDWSDDEIELLTTISGQIGTALDAARLYQDTQRTAAREQVTGEVTARIRQTLDMQTVLRTAVEEIQRHLNLPEVVISLSAPEEGGPQDDPDLSQEPGSEVYKASW